MELREFITSTLLDVMHGIRDAQKKWNDESGGMGAVNPVWNETTQRDISKIQFDVAVTAESKNGAGMNAGITVMGLGIGGKMEGSHNNATVSRIQFEVPVIAPTITIKQTPKPLPSIPSTKFA